MVAPGFYSTALDFMRLLNIEPKGRLGGCGGICIILMPNDGAILLYDYAAAAATAVC